MRKTDDEEGRKSERRSRRRKNTRRRRRKGRRSRAGWYRGKTVDLYSECTGFISRSDCTFLVLLLFLPLSGRMPW
jgi:hypothetical protein